MFTRKNFKTENSSGMALAVTLLILLILSVLALTIGTVGISNLNLVKTHRDSTTAYYAAKAGASKAVNEIYNNSSWTTGFNQQSLTSVNGTYTVAFGSGHFDSTNNISGTSTITRSDGIQVPAGYAYIVSTGEVNDSVQRIAVLVRYSASGNPPWNYALFGYDYLEVGGTGDVVGDVGTNAPSMNIHGSGSVTGDQDTNAGESQPVVNLPYSVAGTTNLTDTGTYPPGNYGYISLSGGGSAGKTVTLSAGTYQFTSIDLQSKGKIAISSGPVEIYVTGDLRLTGQSVTNTSHDATKCIFYGGTTCTTVTVNGGADAYFALYAPNATLNFAGNSDLHGSAIGQNSTGIGTAAIIHDPNLDSMTGGGSTFPEVTTWQNVY